MTKTCPHKGEVTEYGTYFCKKKTVDDSIGNYVFAKFCESVCDGNYSAETEASFNEQNYFNAFFGGLIDD